MSKFLYPLKAKLSIFFSISLNSLIYIILFSVMIHTSVNAQKQSKKAIAKEYENKTLPEIKEDFIKIKNDIQKMQSLSSLRISGGPATDIKTRHTPNFLIKKEELVFKEFDSLKKDISFYQKIIDDTSYVKFRIPYELENYPQSYRSIEIDENDFTVNKLYYFDGKKQNIELKETELTINNLKKMDSALVTFEYQYVKDYKKVSLDNENKNTEDGKIKLSFIKKDEVEFKIDSLLSERILHIEAIDASGKALWKKSSFKSQSNAKSQEAYLKEVASFVENVIQKIESKNITAKKELINYMYEHQPSKKIISKEKPKVTYFNTYAGEIQSINIYFNPIIADKKETFYVSNSRKYISGVEIAQKNDKQGLINEKGEWVVSPTYSNLSNSIVDNYYNVYIGDKKKLYRFSQNAKTLAPVSYYLMGKKVYNDRYLEICANPNHNFEKGLVDLKTSKIILKPVDRSLTTNPNFYMSTKHKGNDIRLYEIFRFSDHKKILEGNFDNVKLDKDLVIVEYLKELSEKPEGYGYTNSFRNGKRRYYYRYIDIYNKNGMKINKSSYNSFPDDNHFSKNDLLLLDKKSDRTKSGYDYVFINRKGEEHKIDLTPYKKVESFSNGLAIVKDKETSKYGFINSKGILIIPTMYESANHFIGGSAMVSFGKKGDHKTVLINTENKIIFTFPSSVYSHSAKHDSQEGSYTTRLGTFNHKGEKISEDD